MKDYLRVDVLEKGNSRHTWNRVMELITCGEDIHLGQHRG
jgi:hypothetical protein